MKNLTHKLKRNLNNTINRDIERNKSLNLSKNEISPVKNSNLINNFFPLDSTERNNENNEENLDLSYKSLEKSHKSLEKSPNKSFEQSYKAINNEKVLNPDNSENLQDYIREQEAYLEKLEADRKNLKRKLQETSESPFENQLSPLDFIQNLHEKENSFINSHEYSQEKAQMLLEKFLGNEKTPKEGRIFKNNDNEERFNSTEGLIVRNSRRTPQKIEGTYIKTKETTPMSDLSYSISQDPVFSFIFILILTFLKSPEKSLKKRQISFESSLEKIKSNDRKEVFLEKSLENQVKDEKRELLFEKSFEKPDFSKKNEKELNYQESSKEEGLSLAEIFRRKKGKLIQKMEENKHENKEEFSRQRTEEFKTRTKEEILKLRKEMMKKPNFLKKNEKIDDIKEETTSDNVLRKNEKEGTVELMERLALGIKTKVINIIIILLRVFYIILKKNYKDSQNILFL